MVPVRAVGTAGVTARWRRENRPDFPGIAVWVDAVAEVEISGVEIGSEVFGGAAADADGWPGHWRAGGAADSGVTAEGGRWQDYRQAGAAADGEEWPAYRRSGAAADQGDESGHGFAAGDVGGEWAHGDQTAEHTESGERVPRAGERSESGERVPSEVDAWSSGYSKVWRPLSGNGREPRPGLLLSVVRAGVVVACPAPLSDPPTGALAHALARVEAPERGPAVLPVEAQPAPPPRRTPPQKAYNEVRALVGVLVEVLVGRRTATHAASWTEPEVRGKLRTPRYARTASLKSVRLSESGDGVEALALLRDGSRTRAVALRFDRAADARWRCTALLAG